MVNLFKVAATAAAWAEKALAGGKVTKVEALKLAIDLAGVLSLPVESGMEIVEDVVEAVEDKGQAGEKEPPRVTKPEE